MKGIYKQSTLSGALVLAIAGMVWPLFAYGTPSELLSVPLNDETMIPRMIPKADKQIDKWTTGEGRNGNQASPVVKAVIEAGKLVREKKYDDALGRLNDADRLQGKSAYETYLVERTRVTVAAMTGNDALLASSLEATIASGYPSGKEKLDLMEALAGDYYEKKDYANSAKWLKAYFQEGGEKGDARAMLVRASYFQGDFAEAAKAARLDIDASEKSGTPPAEDILKIYTSSTYKLKDNPGYRYAVERLARYYPKKEYWVALLQFVTSNPGFPERLGLDAYRFMLATGQFANAEDYVAMCHAAMESGYPGEARKVAEQGFKAGILGGGPNAADHQKMLNQAIKAEAADIKEFPKEEASLTKTKDADDLVKLGYSYATSGQIDKGIELMRQGIAAGRLTHPNEAKLHLALAYIMAARKTEALQILDTVEGGKDGSGDLARYWSIYLTGASGNAAG